MPTLAGFDNTRQQIMDALVDRVVGTEIQPEAHQKFALALLEYIRSVELISASTLIGQCTPETQPVQPNDANVAYVGTALQQTTTIWENFHGEDGQPIIITTTSSNVAICIFTWNRQYWTVTTTTIDLTDILQQTNQEIQNLQSSLTEETRAREKGDENLDKKIQQETQAIETSLNQLNNQLKDCKFIYLSVEEYQKLITDNQIDETTTYFIYEE